MATVVAAGALFGVQSPVSAAIPDAGLPAEPVPENPLVSERTEILQAGVVGENQNGDSFPNTDVSVLAFAEHDDVIYVGGKFTAVRRVGSGDVAQPFLAAFDRESGAWIESFRPSLDGNVWDLKVTDDGDLLVAGQFKSVNGEPDTAALARIDLATGEVDADWRVRVRLTGTTRWPLVRALDIEGDDLYLGGNFTRVMGPNGVEKNAGRIARVSLATGNVDGAFLPNIDGIVFDIDADGDRVYTVGNFFYTNGVWTIGLSVTYAANGQVVPDLEPWVRTYVKNTLNSYQQAVLVVGDEVWQTGAQHNTQVSVRADHSMIRTYVTDPNGDGQALAFNDGIVYQGSHANWYTYMYTDATRYPVSESPTSWTSKDPSRWMGAFDAENHVYLDWYPQVGTRNGEGAWELFVDSEDCLWAGGDFNRGSYDGSTPRFVEGFAKFCKNDTTPPEPPTNPTARDRGDGGVDLAWEASPGDDRGGEVYYELLKNGEVFATFISITSFPDPDGTTRDRYFVRAVDRAGNKSATTRVFQTADVDSDGDGIFDRADPDDDNDGVVDENDAFPFDPAESADSDGDGVGDNADAFPNDPAESVDSDGDGVGNNADVDADNDGLADPVESRSARLADEWPRLDAGWSYADGALTASGSRSWRSQANSVRLSEWGFDDEYRFEFTVRESSGVVMIGLGVAEGNASYTDIDFAWYLTTSQTIIYESGVAQARGLPAPAAGDVYAIEKSGTTLRYLLNGEVVRTRSAPAGADLYVDSSQYSGTTVFDEIEVVLLGGAADGDADADGVANDVDLDSDNDSIPDVVEAGLADANGDFRVDEVGLQATVNPAPDTDRDGTPDYLDVDSDGDGTFDIAGTAFAALDTNGDGRLDVADAGGGVDANGNGVDDLVEPDRQNPSTPQNLAAQVEVDGDVTLSWDAAADNVGVTEYQVLRNGAEIGVVPSLRFTVPAPAPGSHWYQVRARDAAGNEGFKTPSVRVDIEAPDTQKPSTPQNLAARVEANGDVTLSWDAATDNVAVAEYQVLRNGVEIGLTPTPGFTVPAPAAGAHWYQVRARDAAGNESFKTPSVRVDIAPPDTTRPSTPQNLVAVVEANGDVTLTWDAASDNVGVVEYVVERNAAEIGRSGGATSFVVPAPAPGPHWYQVYALDAAGNQSFDTPSVRVDIVAADTQSPSTPQNLAAQVEANGDVTLTWDAATDNVGVTEYQVLRNGVEIGLTATPGFTVPTPAPGSHWYQVRARDAAGNEGFKTPSVRVDIVPPDTQAPTTPQNLAAQVEANGDVTLSWDAATDDVGVVEYQVLRNGVEIGVTADLVFVVPTPATGSHWYQVRARDAAGNEGNKTAPVQVDIV